MEQVVIESLLDTLKQRISSYGHAKQSLGCAETNLTDANVRMKSDDIEYWQERVEAWIQYVREWEDRIEFSLRAIKDAIYSETIG